MKISTSSSNSFSKALLVYAIIFLTITLVGLIFFWCWIKEYEDSRPLSTVQTYIDKLDYDKVQEISTDIISELGNSSESEVDTIEALLEILKSSEPVKSVTDSSENEQIYLLKYDGSYVERLSLKPSGKSVLGFNPWIVNEEVLLKDNLVSSSTISIPESWTVKCNGENLGEEDLTGNKTEYSLLSGFYEDLDNLPYIVEYSTGLNFGDTELEIYDSDNNKFSQDEISEELFTNNCTASDISRLKDFCQLYIIKYVNYTSYGVGNGMAAYYGLLELIDKQSSLYEQIKDSLQGFGYASSLGDEVQDVRVPQCMYVGNDTYVCNIEYDLKTYGRHSTITEETLYMRLAIKEIDGELKAIAYINY